MFMWPWSPSVVVGRKATTRLNQISISMEKSATNWHFKFKILCEDPEETIGFFKYRQNFVNRGKQPYPKYFCTNPLL